MPSKYENYGNSNVRRKSQPQARLDASVDIHKETKGEWIERARSERTAQYEETERVYVEGFTNEDGALIWPSYRQMSEMFGIPMSTLARYGSKNDWYLKRMEFKDKIKDARQNKIVEITSDTMAKLDLKAAQIALDGLDRLQDFVAEAAVTELYNISSAARAFHQMGRLAVGGSTSNEKIDINLMKEAKSRLLGQFESIAARIEDRAKNVSH